MIKSLLLRLVRALGYDLVPRAGRSALSGVLANAKRCGLAPELVIDVGAGRGDFARLAASVFPKAEFLLVEPLREFDADLSRACADLPKARRISAVAAAQAGEVRLNVHPDLFGSSLLLEDEGTDVNGSPRAVPAVTLDSLASGAGPVLLKIDVQGAELEALKGGVETLKRAELVVLETSFFRFFGQGPLFSEVVAFMEGQGFALYDLFGLAHRPLDGALAQADAVFAKAGGPLRRHHHYATPEQRAKLTKRLAG
jgi:FkbM family methyltransferase